MSNQFMKTSSFFLNNKNNHEEETINTSSLAIVINGDLGDNLRK